MTGSRQRPSRREALFDTRITTTRFSVMTLGKRPQEGDKAKHPGPHTAVQSLVDGLTLTLTLS